MMAPSLENYIHSSSATCSATESLKPSFRAIKITAVSKYTPGRNEIERHEDYEYEDLKPYFPNVKWPALEEVPYEDKGLLGDPEFRNLKAIATDIIDYV